MYQDHSLLPREAVRLAALGVLATAPMPYAALAAEVRGFTSRIAGPSLELMGTSIELLRYEGFVRAVDDDRLALTEDGRAELMRLLRAALRPPMNDVARLVLALKFRFLHLLPPEDRRVQLAMMIEASESELARLADLRARHAGEPGHLIEWLDREIAAVEDRLAWLCDFHQRLDGAGAARATAGAGRR